MSRWLADRLHVTLAPDRVSVARTALRLGWRGVRQTPLTTDVIGVAAGSGEEPSWQAPLAALAKELGKRDAYSGRPARATLVLSNHFVRYALVPRSDLIDDQEEDNAHSRHFLRQLFGAAADRWELRTTVGNRWASKLVSAVEPDLLAELRKLFGGRGIRLVSIQPNLMAICNRHGHRLGPRDAWLAVVEPGSLCLTLMEEGRVVRLRQLRIGAAWAADLMAALEREIYIGDSEVVTRDVFLAAATATDLPLPADLPWHILPLELPAAAAAPAESPGLALATGE